MSAVPNPTLRAGGSRPLQAVLAEIDQVVLGKATEVRLALACLLAGGHLLIQDIPGVGKTTLAHALAQTLGLEFQRVQGTSDLLPADIIGVSVFERGEGAGGFRFHPGPVFSQVLLVDELNRAPPKSQSALLEAMAEHQVSIDGVRRELPTPFFVLATQNPLDLVGTYPLPESQLDRFMFCLSLGYPDVDTEQRLLSGHGDLAAMPTARPVLTPVQVLAAMAAVRDVTVRPALVAYVQALLQASRHHADIRLGLSPRAGLALIAAARAWALLAGRDHVLPDDVQTVFVPLARHRLHPQPQSLLDGTALARQLLSATAIP
ncbi:MAG: MoxR family ATPase [Xanthomonadales bacterium]|nr:MoxR family ATPase [Xanthomonadales bacterium]